MQAGSFYCFVTRKGGVSGWLPFCRNSQRNVYRKINGLLKRDTQGDSEGTAALDDSDLFHCEHHDKCNDSVSFVYPGAGVTVQKGVVHLTSQLSRKEPNIYATEKAFIVLCGYISNVEDLCARMGRWSPYSFKDFVVENDEEDAAELTIGDLTARVILNMYLGDKAKDPLLLLSELQGHYAFVIYDGEDKNAFAARDASGKQSLYFTTDNEKGISLSNAATIELEGTEETWVEIPPGHYLHGRHPQLCQFALTPDQLTARWSLDLDEETELYSSLDSATEHEHRRTWSLRIAGSFRSRISPQPQHNNYSNALFPQTL